MSDQGVKSISNATGSYVAMSPRAEHSVDSGGNEPPASGNDVPQSKPEKPELAEIAAKLNSISRSIGRDLRFKIDLNNGSSVIQVLDRDTGELIREIPPEKAELSMSLNGDVQIKLYDKVV